MNENEKLILKNLVVGKSFNTFEALIEYIIQGQCQYNIDMFDILFREMLSNLEKNEKNIMRYQIIFNAIIINKNRDKMYHQNSLSLSIYELVRQLTYIFQDNIYKFLSGVLEVRVGIVEVNKRGLKIKHFAYDMTYQINDLVYIDNLTPDNIFLVSDYYEIEIKNLIPYILHVSSQFVYHFDIGYEEIAKVSIEKLTEKRVCQIMLDQPYLCYIDFDFYKGMTVEFIYENERNIGEIEEEIYYYEPEEIKGQVIRAIIESVPKLLKEKRGIDEKVAKYFDYSLPDFYTLLNNKNSESQYKIITKLRDLIHLISSNQKLNVIEEVNLYYRPVINYLLIKHSPNEYYYQNEHFCNSLLNYFSLLERLRSNILGFLFDKEYDYGINIVHINVNGRIKKCFAYNNIYQIGEPVFIFLDIQYHIGFVHDKQIIPLTELRHDIAYYESAYVTPIISLKENIIKRSHIDNYHIIIRVKDNGVDRYAIIRNYVPYAGEILTVKDKKYLVIEEPKAVSKDLYDTDEMLLIDM